MLITRSVIRDTKRGIQAGSLSDVGIFDSVIADTYEYGIAVSGGRASVTRSLVRNAGVGAVLVAPTTPIGVFSMADSRIECLSSAEGLLLHSAAARITRSAITGCGTAVLVANSSVSLWGNTIFGNTFGLHLHSGCVASSGNNAITSNVVNVTPVSGTLTTEPLI